jgi:hypothetical protein
MDAKAFFVDIPNELVKKIELNVSSMPSDEKIGEVCLPDDELNRFFKKKVGQGACGSVMAACGNDDAKCDYVAKIRRWQKTDALAEADFRLECGLCNFASEHAFGPHIQCCVICKSSASDQVVGLIVMKLLKTTMYRKQVTNTFTEKDFLSAFGVIQRMHASGIWHSDLSSSNIMYDQEDKAFIIDFGAAWPFLDQPIPAPLRMVDFIQCLYSVVVMGENQKPVKVRRDWTNYMMSPLTALFGPEDVNQLIIDAYHMAVYDQNQYWVLGQRAKVDALRMYTLAIQAIPLDVIRNFGAVLTEYRLINLFTEKLTERSNRLDLNRRMNARLQD